MVEVPAVRVLSAHAVQVGTGALAAPLERVVVHELTRLAVLAVALGLAAEGPDHLRMAGIAAFGDVDVAPLELQRV